MSERGACPLAASEEDARTVEGIIAERAERNRGLDWDLPATVPEVSEP